jgi:membrane-bound lytic murein transglycosylase C
MLFFGLSVCSASESDEFQKFLNNEYSEFSSYKKQLESEFREYKRVYQEEFNKYVSNISKEWNELDISSKKRWVEYSDDYKVKKIVDFEKKEVTIEIIVDKKKHLKEKVKKELKDLLTEDTSTAWKRNPVAQNVEKRLNKKVKHKLKAPVKPKPILQDIYFKKKPNKRVLDKTVEQLLKKSKIKSKREKKKVISVKIKLPNNTTLKKALSVKPYVKKYSYKQKLPTELVFAIIHNESYFNPMATSHVPAYGLMQIVPKTAGVDATQYLYGKGKVLLPSYLYNGENNVNIGTAYLYLLYYRYLRKINNPTSRLYCTIAAYNTGAGNVAYAFTKTRNINKAARVINSKTPSEVYKILLKKLPYVETKNI